MTTLNEAFAAVDAACNAHDLFNGDKDKAQKVYRDLAKVLHPDHVPPTKMAEANTAFAKLASLWDAYSSGDADRPFASTTIATRKRAYVVGDLIAQGDIAGIYGASYREDDETHRAVLKMTRSPANNDLTENEARVLRHLADNADPLGLPYFSQLLDAFKYRDVKTNADRQVNVLTLLDGWFTLAEVKHAYPHGLDVRDAAWMWKRLLIAIGHAHRAGVVHGAVLHHHVMIHPEQHGLVLVGWSYATIEKPATTTISLDPYTYTDVTVEDHGGFSPLKAVVPQYKAFYPPEVFDKAPVDSTTDIYMASLLMTWLLDANTPRPFRAFINGCALKSPSQRPQDAWQVMQELTDLLAIHIGPRKFRSFRMPGK